MTEGEALGIARLGVAARDEADASALIAGMVEECRRGASDREAEAVTLAELWGFEVDPVRERFAIARDVRAKPAVEVFKRRRILPDEPKARAGFAERLGTAIARGRAERAPGEKPLPARVEPKAEVEVELAAAKARIAGLEGAKPVRFAPGPVEGEVVLSASSPYDTAKEFTKRYCAQDGVVIVFFSQDQFWRWNGRHYAVEPIDNIKAQVYAFLDGALKWVGGNKTRFQPTPKTVNDVMDGLKYGLKLPPEVKPPMWLGTHEPATDWVVFQNGAVNVLTARCGIPRRCCGSSRR
jgi:hypothetical protein